MANDRPRRRRAFSDETTETANRASSPRFPIDGPGKPYIIFAIAATTVIVAALVLSEVMAFFVPIDRGMFGVFLAGSPIWLIGHYCIYAGGARINRGAATRGLVWIWIAGIATIASLGFIWFLLSLGMRMSEGRTTWSFSVYFYSYPIYAITILLVLAGTYFSNAARRSDKAGNDSPTTANN